MRSYDLPVNVCKKIDSRIRDFWWGHVSDKHKMLYLKALHSLCTPKEVGGLGFKSMRDMNETFITKLTWQISTKKNTLWIKVLHDRYLKGLEFLNATQQPKRCSWI